MADNDRTQRVGLGALVEAHPRVLDTDDLVEH
jgi:hypothetical protein